MGKKDANYIKIKKENDVIKEALKKYNSALSSRDIEIDNLIENEESKGLFYT